MNLSKGFSFWIFFQGHPGFGILKPIKNCYCRWVFSWTISLRWSWCATGWIFFWNFMCFGWLVLFWGWRFKDWVGWWRSSGWCSCSIRRISLMWIRRSRHRPTRSWSCFRLLSGWFVCDVGRLLCSCELFLSRWSYELSSCPTSCLRTRSSFFPYVMFDCPYLETNGLGRTICFPWWRSKGIFPLQVVLFCWRLSLWLRRFCIDLTWISTWWRCWVLLLSGFSFLFCKLSCNRLKYIPRSLLSGWRLYLMVKDSWRSLMRFICITFAIFWILQAYWSTYWNSRTWRWPLFRCHFLF